MSMFGGRLHSPELKTDHPIIIVPVLDAADGNRVTTVPSEPFDDLDEGKAGGPAGSTVRPGVSEWRVTEAYDLDWPEVAGAVKYRLWTSMSPAAYDPGKDRLPTLAQDDLTEPHARFLPPYFSEVVAYFFWVSSLDSQGRETFLTADPASLMATAEKLAFNGTQITDDPAFYPGAAELDRAMGQAVEFIRSSNRLDLEIGNEPARLFLRRHASDKPWGIPCSCVRRIDLMDSDPNYQGSGNCKLCFNTRIFGGYLPSIPIAVRYGNAPEQAFVRKKSGFELQHVFNTAMLWMPVVRVEDLVVLERSGRRFKVTKVSPDVGMRAVRLQQFFDLDEVKKTSIEYEVTDDAIQKGLDKAKLPGFLRQGYKSFG